MSDGVFMAGGWWYCDCNDEALQELEEKRPPHHEGDTNRCPRCGTVWVGKPMVSQVVTEKGIVPTPDFYWWRPSRPQA